MTEEYEYERVEIKPGDKSWVGKDIYFLYCSINGDSKSPKAVMYNSDEILILKGKKEEAYRHECLMPDFYTRKPKRKMVKKALAMLERYECGPGWVLKPSDRAETLEYFERVYTKDRIKKWPYGEIIEVPEGVKE